MQEAIERRQYVPKDLDPGDWSRLEPLYQELLDRPLATLDELRAWLANFSELSAAVYEYGSRRHIDHACHTDDEEIDKAYMNWVENIKPKLQPAFFKLQKKFLECPAHSELPADTFEVMSREWQAQVDLFRDENVPLLTELTKLNTEYDKLIGAMTVDFQGETLTLQQLGRFLEEPDRDTRERTWTLSANRRMEDHEKIDGIFDKMIKLRQQVAQNADEPDFVAYSWKNRLRFDYTPEDCLAFGKAVEEVVMPRVNKLMEQRREALGVESLRPWDLNVDVLSRPPLRPFGRDEPMELVDKTNEVFSRIWPPLAEAFGTLQYGRNLDLQSRKGKMAGGFQASLVEVGEPFIFMNAAGVHRDVVTMLHEGGHAFHSMWAYEKLPIVFVRHAPYEFCEVASMAMELLADDHLDVFYEDEAAANRAKRDHLAGILRLLPWVATIDGFQHWLYKHPNHTQEQRTAAWLELLSRFESPLIDYTGHEAFRAASWQRQGHLFHAPFYYIEYGIAQLGSLQLWLNYRDDPNAALEKYRNSLALGGTRPLPELFDAAAIKFDFTRDTIEPLMEAVEDELDELPV